MRRHVPPHVARAAELGRALGAGVRLLATAAGASPADKVGVVVEALLPLKPLAAH